MVCQPFTICGSNRIGNSKSAYQPASCGSHVTSTHVQLQAVYIPPVSVQSTCCHCTCSGTAPCLSQTEDDVLYFWRALILWRWVNLQKMLEQTETMQHIMLKFKVNCACLHEKQKQISVKKLNIKNSSNNRISAMQMQLQLAFWPQL